MDGAPDNRLEFLGNFIQKTLKLKPEKWSRLLATEEYKNVVMDFLDKPEPVLLIILQNNAAQLIPATSFPVSLKSKAAYFIKRSKLSVPKECLNEALILGDMATKPIEQLATLVDEIFVPLLSNSSNHNNWPPTVAQDVSQHVHSLKSTVYQVKGQVSGQTVLPMPVGVDRVHHAERMLISSGGEVVDLYLKSAIEGVVIKWATQINDILNEDSSQAFANGQNPVPAAEVNFWNGRLRNLQNIYEQLRDERVRKMATILERTDSAYFPCFRNLFRNIVAALAEAKDIAKFLKPLLKHFALLEETDFADVEIYLKPLMHTVCLVWGHSRYYCNSGKIIVLLKEICNLIIQQAKKFLDPSSIFQSDVDEAKQRVELTIDTLKTFREIFDEYKDNLAPFFKDRPPVMWTFHPNIIFGRFQLFLDRLHTIQWFFDTVLEFLKLERVEIGGLKGRALSSRIITVSREFNDHFMVFSSKTYDVLDPEDGSFVEDYKVFQANIQDLDRRLASILCQAFDDCFNLESIFKLIEIVGSVLERPLIKEEFTGKYKLIVAMLEKEIKTAQELYEEQMVIFQASGRMPVDKFLPPIAGAMRWTDKLRNRILAPVHSFKVLDHPIVHSEEAIAVLKDFEKLMALLNELEEKLFDEWRETVPSQIQRNLKRSLLTRNKAQSELYLNFHPQLTAILHEVRYLQLSEKKGIPEEALQLYEKWETFRKYTIQLNITVDWYNKVRKDSRQVEFQLVKDQINKIDELIQQGQCDLDWTSGDLWEYIQLLHSLVNKLQSGLRKTQENVSQMRNIMLSWIKSPLYERCDGKKDTLLSIDDREEKITKRYNEIKEAGVEIHHLLKENQSLFNMTDNNCVPAWIDYILYIDGIILDGLFRTVGCSIGYIAEHMDPVNELAPLFEAHLELRDPDLVFVPSLDLDGPDGFSSLIQGIVEDIIKMAGLIERVNKSSDNPDYLSSIQDHDDISDMKKDIMEGVEKSLNEANEFCDGFEMYSYLWLDDRTLYMQQFLTYARQLTLEELEAMALGEILEPPQPRNPVMADFKEQIDNFESLYAEIEGLDSIQVFNSWFQVDIRPFKQALLNTVRKWGLMFKQHLIEHVTTSLTELNDFIHKADEGLLQPVEEGNYEGLVNVMGYLLKVKERQATTDEMFEPIRETIDLLKMYEVELPEEVNVLLQELPEQWNNTKKLAITVKQQVAPLQAAEVSAIRNKIVSFDVKQVQYRDQFKRSPFLKYSCEKPYQKLDDTDAVIRSLEQEMQKLQESASLFEVNVPDFKLLRQCRRELRMLKQLWDYVHIVQTSIEDWKTTPWRQIDVENMDIECKKFAKEIRALDKEMRSWDTYIELEATVKNMLTSLRAVGELQNSAIRERHWQQLMKSTKQYRPRKQRKVR